MTDSVLGITGSTGRLGGRIARRLAAAGVPQRLLVRDPARAPQLPGSTVAAGVLRRRGRRAATRSTGLSTVLMVSAAEHPDRVGQHRTFVDAAADAGVEHLVYVSFLGAAPDATFTLARDHWATEEHIRARGLRATFLRDTLYADFFPRLTGDGRRHPRPGRRRAGWPPWRRTTSPTPRSPSSATLPRTPGRPTT